MKKIVAFLFGLGFLFCVPFAFSADVHFQWGKSSGQVDGYRIYAGMVTGGPYPDMKGEVNGTILTQTLTLDGTQEYYLVCRAFNSYGESGNSNEVSWGIAPGLPSDFEWIVEGEITGSIRITPKATSNEHN